MCDIDNQVYSGILQYTMNKADPPESALHIASKIILISITRFWLY